MPKARDLQSRRSPADFSWRTCDRARRIGLDGNPLVRRPRPSKASIVTHDKGLLPPLNWDDLRLVLTVARSGSLNAAAGQLKVNVSTASRRLSQIEAALGLLCFVRRPSGIEPTPAGQIVVDHALEIEKQTVRLRRAAAGEQAASASTVTVTAPDSLGAALVMPTIAEMLCERRALNVNLITDNRILDLHRGEADLALRLRRPENGGLKIRKIAEMRYGLYASAGYLRLHGSPKMVDDLSKHMMIGMRSAYPHHPPAAWWAQRCDVGRVSLRTDRALDRQEAASRDLGITMLPVAIGARAGLHRILADEQLPGLEVFLLADPGALRVRQTREVAEAIASYARRNSAALA